jgi:hypothetical protein
MGRDQSTATRKKEESNQTETCMSVPRLQISRRSHIGRTLQLHKLPLPPLPRFSTLRAGYQGRIDLMAYDGLRCLETQIAMWLSGLSLPGLFGVNLFEPERKQQM